MFKVDFPCTCGQRLILQCDTLGDAERQLVAMFLVKHVHCKGYENWRTLNEFFSRWGAGDMRAIVPDSGNGMRLAPPEHTWWDGQITPARALTAGEEEAMRRSERGRY